MKLGWSSRRNLVGSLILGCLPSISFAGDVLSSSGFTACQNNNSINVQTANVQFDRSTSALNFSVAGTSDSVQNVTATLTVTAYGKQVYTKTIYPCEENIPHLCPVPAGYFSANGNQTIPSQYSSVIPSIAFSLPDLDGDVKIVLNSASGGQPLTCIQSAVGNGKTMDVPAVSYIAAGIAGAALLLTGFSALGSAGQVGGHSPSPSFTTVFTWFQSLQMNGMMSVNYPPLYRSFTKNFAFSGGLIPWTAMQTSIDNFRNSTGGNLTDDSVQYLQNASLVFTDGSSSNSSTAMKRSLDFINRAVLISREFSGNVNGSQAATQNATSATDAKVSHLVYGIQGYVEFLTIPQANTFMTVLLIFSIVIAAITVGILLLKVILETWALFGTFPKKLTSFRKRYWRILAKTITNLILLLYGVWTLYCIFQFTHGDSWAAKLLAGITLGAFTAVLGFFTVRIVILARRYQRAEGDSSVLYEDKETWMKYNLFYDNYKRGYWWLFIPAIIYMFAKGCVLAAGNGHGLAQTSGQLIVEALMLALLLWSRPFATTAGNWINIIVQVVRVLSVVCILVFVEQLGIAQTTKTVTGVVLIAVQSLLTGALGILIAVNSIITCCRENPHRKRRKAAEKLNREFDNLTPLDARNSLLLNSTDYKDALAKPPQVSSYPLDAYSNNGSYEAVPYRDLTPTPGPRGARESSENLVGSAAGMGESMGHRHQRSTSIDSEAQYASLARRQPTVPNFGYRGGF